MIDKKETAETSSDKESWSRFERAVDAAVKSGPLHKPASAPKAGVRPIKKRDPRKSSPKS